MTSPGTLTQNSKGATGRYSLHEVAPLALDYSLHIPMVSNKPQWHVHSSSPLQDDVEQIALGSLLTNDTPGIHLAVPAIAGSAHNCRCMKRFDNKITFTNTRVIQRNRKTPYSMALHNASIFSTVNWRKKGRTPMMATT